MRKPTQGRVGDLRQDVVIGKSLNLRGKNPAFRRFNHNVKDNYKHKGYFIDFIRRYIVNQ